MKLVGIAVPGLAVSSIFAYRPRESSPTREHAQEGALPPGGRSHTSRRKARATPMGAIHPAVPALVREIAREKGIPVGVRGEVAGDPEAMPKPVEAGASLSMVPLSVLEIEKLVGEL